jgi:hypothetical protein
MQRIMKGVLTIVVFAMVIIPALLPQSGYAYVDQLSQTQSETLTAGEWEYPHLPFEYLDYYTSKRFMAYIGVTSIEDLYANADFAAIMDAVSKTASGTSTYTGSGYAITDVNIEGVLWNVEGIKVTTVGNMSLGFLRQIDRSATGTTPVHAVLPSVATDPLPYADYSFFSAYDVRNAITDNAYGFRLDNEVRMTTSSPVAGLESISFYAIRGLRVSSSEKLASNRTFYVQISADGSTWQNVGTTKTLAQMSTNDVDTGTTVSTNFTYYSFALTSTQISQMPSSGYYIRLFFDGGVSGNNNKGTRSRMVVDAFTITTAG